MRKLALLILFFVACSFGPGHFQSRHSSDLEQRKIKRIAILPPTAPAADPQRGIPYAGVAVPAEGKVTEKEAAEILANLLYSAMASLPNWQIVSDLEVREVRREISNGDDVLGAKKLGEMVYADAVLTGRILRYRERVGQEWGAKSPASVSFVLELWDVRRGDLVWSARFEETQKSLSENLFAIGDIASRGVKWLRAEELAREGVKKSVEQLHRALYPRST